MSILGPLIVCFKIMLLFEQHLWSTAGKGHICLVISIGSFQNDWMKDTIVLSIELLNYKFILLQSRCWLPAEIHRMKLYLQSWVKFALEVLSINMKTVLSNIDKKTIPIKIFRFGKFKASFRL